MTVRAGARRNQAAARVGTYVVCLDCGKELAYDWQEMRVTDACHEQRRGPWSPRKPRKRSFRFFVLEEAARSFAAFSLEFDGSGIHSPSITAKPGSTTSEAQFTRCGLTALAGEFLAWGEFFLIFHPNFTNHCVRFDFLKSSDFLEENELGKDMVPKRIFFTKGVGKHRERLTSFELALRDAGIAAQNLVRVSSIFPPNCKLVPSSQGLKHLHPGEVVFAVVAENSTHEPHRLLASSIGVAIPADRNTYGYLSEHHSFGETEDSAGDYAEELAAEMLATTLNVEFDSDRSWDEKKEIYRISNKIVRTANVTQSAVGDKRGLWTTVIASAVLIFD